MTRAGTVEAMSTPRTQRVYNNRKWKIIRAAALARAGYQCELRLPGCTGRATQGDHVLGLEDGGDPFSLSNTQAACRSCNIAKENNRRLVRTAATIHEPSRTW